MKFIKKAQPRIQTSGDKTYFQMGEEGRNRTGKKIACPLSFESEVTISSPTPGKPGNIVVKDSAAATSGSIAYICCNGGYHRGRADRALFRGDFHLIFSGEGRDGIAGNIGSWRDYLIVVDEGRSVDIAIVLDRSTKFARITNGEIHHYSQQEAELHGLSIDKADYSKIVHS